MTAPVITTPKKHAFGITIAYAVSLYIVWIGAWMLSLWLEQQGILPATPAVRFFYWLLMRVLFWLLPSLALLRLLGKSVREVLGFGRIKAILLWGMGAGAVLGIQTLLVRLISHQALFSIDWNWPLLTAVIIGPLVEEITFRGAILGGLQTRLSFAKANLVNGFLFLLAHFPGWYFQGKLMANLTNPLGGAIAIFLLGCLFGYVAHRSKSVAGSTVAHMMNNFFAA